MSATAPHHTACPRRSRATLERAPLAAAAKRPAHGRSQRAPTRRGSATPAGRDHPRAAARPAAWQVALGMLALLCSGIDLG